MPCLSYTVGLTLHTIEEVDSQTQFNYSTVDITTLEESPSAPMDVVLEGKDNNTCVEVTIPKRFSLIKSIMLFLC